MTNVVKVILAIAFAIFVVGFVWAIAVAIKRPNEIVKKTDDKKVEQAIPAPTPTLQVTPTPPAPQKPAKPATPKRRQAKPASRSAVIADQAVVTISYETRATADANAWATAGVDQYGNAYAEAYAN
ncbi:MAG: hypothetical protein HZB70_02400 [Candidatus Berkelbacteria bacterium]|nr:MAG: hypothetical protein HZB70_02400 [Candidatus Berkelbacteria bacterium]QQG51839.1 MAG: hypothetical protein HY845_00595 [Candidatus Berkelbacteria bacterium]